MKRDNVYGGKRMITAISKESGYNEDIVEKVFTATFKVISDKIMEGKTVQASDFGVFKLKHLGTRIKYWDELYPPDSNISEEHLKIHFMAYADLRRRAQRKLNRQKKKKEAEATA